MNITLSAEELKKEFPQFEDFFDRIDELGAKKQEVKDESEKLSEQINQLNKDAYEIHKQIVRTRQELIKMIQEEAKFRISADTPDLPVVGALYKDVNGQLYSGGLFKCIKVEQTIHAFRLYNDQYSIEGYWTVRFNRIHTKTYEIIESNIELYVSSLTPCTMQRLDKNTERKALEKAFKARMGDMDVTTLSKLLDSMGQKDQDII